MGLIFQAIIRHTRPLFKYTAGNNAAAESDNVFITFFDNYILFFAYFYQNLITMFSLFWMLEH